MIRVRRQTPPGAAAGADEATNTDQSRPAANQADSPSPGSADAASAASGPGAAAQPSAAAQDQADVSAQAEISPAVLTDGAAEQPAASEASRPGPGPGRGPDRGPEPASQAGPQPSEADTPRPANQEPQNPPAAEQPLPAIQQPPPAEERPPPPAAQQPPPAADRPGPAGQQPPAEQQATIAPAQPSVAVAAPPAVAGSVIQPAPTNVATPPPVIALPVDGNDPLIGGNIIAAQAEPPVNPNPDQAIPPQNIPPQESLAQPLSTFLTVTQTGIPVVEPTAVVALSDTATLPTDATAVDAPAPTLGGSATTTAALPRLTLTPVNVTGDGNETSSIMDMNPSTMPATQGIAIIFLVLAATGILGFIGFYFYRRVIRWRRRSDWSNDKETTSADVANAVGFSRPAPQPEEMARPENVLTTPPRSSNMFTDPPLRKAFDKLRGRHASFPPPIDAQTQELKNAKIAPQKYY